MVEYDYQLDSIFLSLADSTRRDMIRLLNIYDKMSVGKIALHYKMTFAGVSKHLKVLEQAKLIVKSRKGRQQIVSLNPTAFKHADKYIKQYEQLWQERFDRLEIILN
jgi:DNA-binding transcriptional ArsR family regulator